MKLLLYCTKSKPYLEYKQIPRTLMEIDNSFEGYQCNWVRTEDDENWQLNGKIVAECDFEVEEILYLPNPSEFDRANFLPNEWCYDYIGRYGTSNKGLLKRSCLTTEQLSDYLNTKSNDKKTFGKDTFGYAIHIKNLHIFDTPRELEEYHSYIELLTLFRKNQITHAPQNMQYAYDDKEEKYCLISIRPEWLCKILNGEKTIEVRRKVLKEMLG